MDHILNNWPLSVGDQIYIYYVLVTALLGLFAVNVSSAFRQKLSVKKLVLSLFREVTGADSVENAIRNVFLSLLAISFIILVIDISANGMQL
jgi:hypothetical protein